MVLSGAGAYRTIRIDYRTSCSASSAASPNFWTRAGFSGDTAIRRSLRGSAAHSWPFKPAYWPESGWK